MQNAFPSSDGAADLENNSVFNVVIAYEDFETGKNAKRTYDYLVSHMGEECAFSNQMWKFDVLAIPKLREMAVGDATVADLIIVSSHGGELPQHVQVWLESWTRATSRTIALVALSDADPESAIGHAFLCKVARSAGVEFFAQPEIWVGRTDYVRPGSPEHQDATSKLTASSLASRTLVTLAGVVQPCVEAPRWRAND